MRLEIKIKKEEVIEAVRRYFELFILQGAVGVISLEPVDKVNFEYKSFMVVVNVESGTSDIAFGVPEDEFTTAFTAAGRVIKRKITVE
jgi:hypothetical protein